MGGLFASLRSGVETKSGNFFRSGNLEEMWGGLLASRPARSGAVVNVDSALEVTTVYACVKRIAEGVATVPWKLYQRTPDGKRRIEARSHPLYDLLATAPSDLQNSLEYRETLCLHLALTGDAFSLKNRVGGRIVELIAIPPGNVSIRRHPDAITYRVNFPDGSSETFEQDDIWHIRGPSWDACRGLKPIRLAREAIGLALATEETHSALHANGARPGGVLTVEGKVDDVVKAKIRESFSLLSEGVRNAFRTIVLDMGAKWAPLQVTGVDSQHLETRGFQIEEVCRALGVLPIMVGHYDKAATYASSEQMFLAHLVHTVRPWHQRFEYSGDHRLLSRGERAQGYYTGFVDSAFLRAAAADRAAYNKIALGGGGNPAWLTPNDVRGHEDMDPMEGADHLYAPVNTGPIGPDGRVIGPEQSGTTAGDGNAQT